MIKNQQTTIKHSKRERCYILSIKVLDLVVLETVFYVFTIQANETHVPPPPPWVEPFLNKLGSYRPCGFKQEVFFVFYLNKPINHGGKIKTSQPSWLVFFLSPWLFFLTELAEVFLVMLHTKYTERNSKLKSFLSWKSSVALSLSRVWYLIWHMWTNLTVMKHFSDTFNQSLYIRKNYSKHHDFWTSID